MVQSKEGSSILKKGTQVRNVRIHKPRDIEREREKNTEMLQWLNLNATNKFPPFMGMITAVLAQSGSFVIIKFATKDGINKYVMVVYSMALSTILLLPLAFFNNRSQCPPLTFSLLCSFFFLALLGTSAQIMTYRGIELSSPTLASAMLNLIPAFTFLLALIFRF